MEIHIIAPEYVASSAEKIQAGTDVFEIFMKIASDEKDQIKKKITKVIIHNKKEEFVELNQFSTIADNMLAFNGKIFPVEEKDTFCEWYGLEVSKKSDNEEELSILLLYLSETLSKLVRKMTPEHVTQMVKRYAEFFRNTDFGYEAAEMLIKHSCDQAILNRSLLKKDIRILIQNFSMNVLVH